ncbi:MAG: hypothetical protein WC668_00210 [Patescibacteria group bacterium]|jgi:hypothetical protein
MPLFNIDRPKAERIKSRLVAILPTKKQKREIFLATARRVVGRKVIEWNSCCGTYGQGGPGFLGFKLEKNFRYHEEWLILRIWGADNWLLVNGLWFAADPDQYDIQVPLYSNYYEKEWDNFSELIISERIETFEIAEKTMTITIGSTVISLGDNPEERPRYAGNGDQRKLDEADDLREAWILSPYAWVEI